MSEYRVTVRKKFNHACDACGEDATRRVTYLLHNARRDPQSNAYGRDDCSWCFDAEAWACEEHLKEIERSAPFGMALCSIFLIEKFPHMGIGWMNDDAMSEKLTAELNGQE